MNILLDTHAFIWFLEGSDRLSDAAKQAIEAEENQCYVSIASIWEMAIKESIGKLEMAIPFERLSGLIWENGIEILPIEFEHAQLISRLPFHHKDPFDRIIIAQSIVDNMLIISADAYFSAYTRSIIW